MAVTMFTRFSNIRSLLHLGNVNAISATLNFGQRVHTTPISCLMDEQDFDKYFNEPIGKPTTSKKKMSKAMRVYLERAKAHDEFIKKEVAEYEIGKRHLANMMGEDPDMFTQQDIDRSIEYLFPSGLYEPRARPLMRHPDEIYPSRKAAEFDVTGRPYHSMFYTSKPNYYQTLYNITEEFEMLNKTEDDLIANGKLASEKDKMEVLGSIWLPKADVENIFLEKLYDFEYQYLVTSFERLIKHPLSLNAMDFVMKFRKALVTISHGTSIPAVSTDENGRPYISVKTCQRKSAVADVTIRGNGSGLFNINGHDITYFEESRFREQLVFPLSFTNMADKVDVEATVTGGGPNGQSGAIRWGIAWGLRSFVDKNMIEKMRLAGLLTRDWRRRERKKFGQEGARRKFTWKKR